MTPKGESRSSARLWRSKPSLLRPSYSTRARPANYAASRRPPADPLCRGAGFRLRRGRAPPRARPRRAPRPHPPPRTPRRPLWEILLDPRSIQWLLALGGALLVVGLVIWLATLGIFKHAEVVAVALGLGNAALLGGGWFVTTPHPLPDRRTGPDVAGLPGHALEPLFLPCPRT